MDTKSTKTCNLLDFLVVHKQMSVFDFFGETEFMGPQSEIKLFITGMRKMVPRTTPKARWKKSLKHCSIYMFIFAL